MKGCLQHIGLPESWPQPDPHVCHQQLSNIEYVEMGKYAYGTLYCRDWTHDHVSFDTCHRMQQYHIMLTFSAKQCAHAYIFFS